MASQKSPDHSLFAPGYGPSEQRLSGPGVPNTDGPAAAWARFYTAPDGPGNPVPVVERTRDATPPAPSPFAPPATPKTPPPVPPLNVAAAPRAGEGGRR